MNGVAVVTVKGESVRLKFGLPAVKRIFEKMTEITEGNVYTYVGMAHILYAGYLNDRLLHEDPPVLVFEDFYDYIEDYAIDLVHGEEIKMALQAFEYSRIVKSSAERFRKALEGEEEKKSQLIGTK